MCGIAGIIARDAGAPIDRRMLQAMTSRLSHRGPDDEGLHFAPGVGLGHRRLSIVDLSERGHQPMASPDGRYWIVYNGEIYDHAEQRRRLEARGERFVSDTDTEVILRLYQVHGVECLERLRGMFAFAIWDSQTRSLFAARDRFGQKPFYYHATDRRFTFASELRSLLQDHAIERTVDLEALHHFLSFDYVLGPRTGFSGVQELPPGHWLLAREGTVRVVRYWSPSFAPAVEKPRSIDETCDELVHRLRESVRLRLMSDVPLGVFLSGGVDSAVILLLASQASASPLQTFTLGFRETDFDERAAARETAAYFGTRHHEDEVTPKMTDVLPWLVEHHGQPFADPSSIPTYYLARMASPSIRVALGGDGGDELFAGYARYEKQWLGSPAARLPRRSRRVISRLLSGLETRLPEVRAVRDLRRFSSIDASDAEGLYGHWLLHFDHAEKRELYSGAMWQQFAGLDSSRELARRLRESDAADIVGRCMAADVGTYLPDDILKKVDVTTMACSLEARSPFLDHEFAAFACSLDSSVKLRRGRSKWILKRAFGPLLPRGATRRPKRGFGLPLDRWLRGESSSLLRDTLSSPRALSRGYFKPEVVTRLLDEHQRGTRNWQFHLYNLLVLELWHRRFIDPPRVD